MSDGDRIGELLLLWEERHEHGEDVPVEELCRDCPSLLPAVAAGVESLRRTGWLKQGARSPDTGDGHGGSVSAAAPGTLRLVGGRYLLYRRLGEGGFGEVWRAFDLVVERAVAVKLPKKRPTRSGGADDGFLAEARKAASLDHPGIVPVYDVGAEDGASYIVSKLIEGTDLERRLRSGPVPLREAVRVVAEVARSLHHAHQKGLVHRDIKPANILLDPHGTVFVTDFGIAVTPAEAQALGADSAGTLAYMGPERLAGDGAQADARTDIYSLGVVLYRLLTGRLPFVADSHADLIDRIVNCPVPTPRSLAPAVPVVVERVCLKCLEKNPANRHLTAEAVAHDLDRWLHRTPLRQRVVRWLLVVGVCAALVAGLGLSGALDRSEQMLAPDGGAPLPSSEKLPEPLPPFREVRRIDAHPGAVLAVAYSADGRRVLSAGADGVRVWDVGTGGQLDPVVVADRSVSFRSVAFSPDGKRALVYSRPTTDGGKLTPPSLTGLQLWDVEAKRLALHYDWSTPDLVRLAFTPDGQRFAWVWAGAGKPPPEMTAHRMRISEQRFYGFGIWGTGTWKEHTDVWNFSISVKGNPGTPWAVAFPPKSETVLFALGALPISFPGAPVYLLDTTTGKMLIRFEGHKGGVRALTCAPDGSRFLSGGDDEIVRVWDVATGKLLASLEGHTKGITALTVSPSGGRALSAADDQTVRLWSLDRNEQLHSFTGHKGPVHQLAFAPDGRSAIYGAGDGTLRIIEFPPE